MQKMLPRDLVLAGAIGWREFVDGTYRPVFEDGTGQFVVDNDGKRAYGTFLMVDESAALFAGDR